MKKILCAILALLLLLPVSGVLADEPDWKIESPKDRVLEVTYNTYDPVAISEGIHYLDKYDVLFKATGGGCSSIKVQVGDTVYAGRDFDFYCSNSPAFIVRLNNLKYRTIGIGNSPAALPDWTEGYVLSDTLFNVLPFLCCDVMNDNGVYGETNIRISEDDLVCRFTNPGKPRRCTQTFLQTMLSQYGSIDEILRHIDDYDWFDLEGIGFCQCFFLVDKTGKSVIVEFARNTWAASNTDSNVNYFVNPYFYALEDYPVGEKRIEKSLELRAFVKDEQDIFTMMYPAFYSQFNKDDCDLDLAIGEYMQDLGYTRFNIDENREEARVKMLELLKTNDAYTWDELVANSCWETVFCNAVNVTEQTFNVHFSEHYNIHFKVAFDD